MLRMKTVTMRLEEGVRASSCFCSLKVEVRMQKLKVKIHLSFASINFNRDPGSTVGSRMLFKASMMFVINWNGLLEEERHLVGHINGQLAEKLLIDIVKTWQKRK